MRGKIAENANGAIVLNNSVTTRQMFFILFMTLSGVTIVSLPRVMAQEASFGGWFTLLLTAVIYAIPAFIIVALNRMFQGEVLFDYSKRLVGKFGSYILGVFYMFYFLLASGYLCGNMAQILSDNFFPKTPPLGVVLIGAPFYAYTAYKGIRATARVCEMIGLLFITVGISIHIIMVLQSDVHNIQPLFVPEDTIRYFRAIPAAMTSFLGIEVMTMIPIAQQYRKKAPAAAFLTILFIGLFFVLVVESSIMIMGMNEIKNDNSALITAIRFIEVPVLSFFERMDVFYLTVGFSGMFVAKTVAILLTSEYACRLMPKVKRIVIVIAVTVIVIGIDVLYYNIKGFDEFFKVFFLSAGNAAAIGIPLILLIIAKVKGHAYKAN
jgi:spore germination protein (amino acid permease)